MAKERKTGRAQVGLRVSEDMRRRLEKAAKDRNVSINAEILERLERSFGIEDRFGGPRVIELIETIAAVMKSTGEHAGFYETGKVTNQGEWLALPYAYDQSTKAVAAVLKHHRPPGKVVVPKPSVIQIGGDPTETAARLTQMLTELGPLMAAREIKKREQDDG